MSGSILPLRSCQPRFPVASDGSSCLGVLQALGSSPFRFHLPLRFPLPSGSLCLRFLPIKLNDGSLCLVGNSLRPASVFKFRVGLTRMESAATPLSADASDLQAPAIRWTYKFESADSPSAVKPRTPYCVISCRRNCKNTGAARALVKISACCSFVGTHLSTTSPCSTDSVTK